MKEKALRTKTVRKTKLWSDFGNHVSKPLGVLLMAGYPYAAILFYSLSLYFSIQHNRAHLKRIEAKAQKQGKTLNLAMKTWTMLARLGFDVLGLGLSIVLLGLSIWFASLIPHHLGEGLLLVACVGMTASSVASTLHKVRRLWKGDYDWNWGDIGRAVFGLAGTVFFACVLFGVIPSALLTNPWYIFGGVIVLGSMAVIKMKNAIDAGRETSSLLDALYRVPKNNLEQFIGESKDHLIALQDLGYVDFEILLDDVLDDIEELAKTSPQHDEDIIKGFYSTFNRVYTSKPMRSPSWRPSSPRPSLFDENGSPRQSEPIPIPIPSPQKLGHNSIDFDVNGKPSTSPPLCILYQGDQNPKQIGMQSLQQGSKSKSDQRFV